MKEKKLKVYTIWRRMPIATKISDLLVVKVKLKPKPSWILVLLTFLISYCPTFCTPIRGHLPQSHSPTHPPLPISSGAAPPPAPPPPPHICVQVLPPPFTVGAKEIENYYRMCSIILDLSTRFLREMLTSYMPPHMCPKSITVAKGVKYTKEQEAIVRNISIHKSYMDCDASLIYLLFRAVVPKVNFQPTIPWGKPVPKTAKLPADDVERIRLWRNYIAHASDNRIDSVTYARFIAEIEGIMKRADSNYHGKVVLSNAGTFVDELLRLCTCPLESESWEVKKKVNKLEKETSEAATRMQLNERRTMVLNSRTALLHERASELEIASQETQTRLKISDIKVEKLDLKMTMRYDKLSQRQDKLNEKISAAFQSLRRQLAGTNPPADEAFQRSITVLPPQFEENWLSLSEEDLEDGTYIKEGSSSRRSSDKIHTLLRVVIWLQIFVLILGSVLLSIVGTIYFRKIP